MKGPGPVARRTAVRKKRPTPRRTSLFRCRPYLDWLHDRKCVVCAIRGTIPLGYLCAHSAGPIDPAHGPPAGMRLKGPDDGAIPLCRWHHCEQTETGWDAFEKKYGFSRAKEAATHFALFCIDRETI